MKVTALKRFNSLTKGEIQKGDKIECSKELADAWEKEGLVKVEKPVNKKNPITKKGAHSKK